MGIIQNFLKQRKERKEEEEGFKRTQHIQERFEEKKLSSNERELRRWLEEERQKRIKAALEKFRKRENDEIWGGRRGNSLSAPNITKNHKQLFTAENTIGKPSSKIIKKNLFFKG